MGWFGKVVVGRWLGRWLLRGGPWSIAAKLFGVVLYGAWKWRREAKRVEQAHASREIQADYEVIEDAPAEGRRVPSPEEPARSRRGMEADPGTIHSSDPSSKPRNDDRAGGRR